MMGLIAGIVILLGFAVLVVAIVLFRAFTRRQDNGPVADEVRLVQDMYRTLERLEKRVDVLETLLADHPHSSHDWPRDDQRPNPRRTGDRYDPH